MTNTEITKGLQIIKLKGVKFGNKLAFTKFEKGYALYHKELGFMAFKADNQNKPFGVAIPYTPSGGRKALQAILEAGGLIHYNDVEWLQPIN